VGSRWFIRERPLLPLQITEPMRARHWFAAADKHLDIIERDSLLFSRGCRKVHAEAPAQPQRGKQKRRQRMSSGNHRSRPQLAQLRRDGTHINVSRLVVTARLVMKARWFEALQNRLNMPASVLDPAKR